MRRWSRWLIGLILLIGGPAPAEVPATEVDVTAVEAGFIYNFTRFIRWPDKAGLPRPQAFVIAVIGDPAIHEQLSLLERKGRMVGDLPIRVIESAADPAAIPDCSILFIGAASVAQLDRILARVASRPLLVVADTPGWAERGVAINFYRRRGRIRFEINPRALRRAGLVAEAQLFDVARIVE